MQITMNLTGFFNNHRTYRLMVCLALLLPVVLSAQIRMLHGDPEFDEQIIRKHLLIRGFSADSAEVMLNKFKYQYYQNMEVMKSQKSLSAPEDDGTAINRICDCYTKLTCWTAAGDEVPTEPIPGVRYMEEHESNLPYPTQVTANSFGNFFDNEETGIDKWFTKIGHYVDAGIHWSYTGLNPASPSTSWTVLNSGFVGGYQPFKVNTDPEALDPFTKQPVIRRGSTRSVRMGDGTMGIIGHKLATRFTIGPDDASFDLNYSVIMFDPPSGHTHPETRPAFSIRVFVNIPEGEGQPNLEEFYEDCCMKYEIYSSPDIPGFVQKGSQIVYKPWSLRTIDLKRYPEGSEIIIDISTHNCAYGPHFSYAYIDGEVNSMRKLNLQGPLCGNTPLRFSSGVLGTFKTEKLNWTLTEDSDPEHPIIHTKEVIVTYPPYRTIEDLIKDPAYADLVSYTRTTTEELTELNYTLTLEVSNAGAEPPDCPPIKIVHPFKLRDCFPVKVECEDCIPSFSPLPGKKYVVSGWVKQKSTSFLTTYTGPEIWITFNGVNTEVGPYTGSGTIIDGWQKIEQVFTIPEETSSIEIKLKNAATDDVLFDDIRVYPFDGALRSFVYSDRDFKLKAELDENNYATFYDYDEQGDLVRVRKETLKGIQTVKEIFTNTHSKP